MPRPSTATVSLTGSVLARLILGSVMLVAGVLKLPDPAGNVRAVRAFQLLPEAGVPTVGHLLPIVEVLLGILLLLGLLTRTAAALTGLFQVAFIVGIAAAWARGLEIDCGCFGGGGEQAGASSKYPFDIARDVFFVALATWIVLRPGRRWSADRLAFGTQEGPETLGAHDPDPLAHGVVRRSPATGNTPLRGVDA